MKEILDEFKTFIARGNVIDLAVGVIMGSAFGKIVTSLVDNILMPIIGVLTGGINFSGLTIRVREATIYYGIFLQNIIDFLIVAACIFMLIKFINKLTKKEEKKKETKKADNIILLEEIRDLLKTQKNGEENNK